MEMIWILIGYLAAVNLTAYGYFGLDKRRAREGGWRISENFLLLLAFCGGWPGAKLAQRRFRHKTRKRPFATLLNAIPLIWMAILALPLAMSQLSVVPPLMASWVATESWAATEEISERRTPRFFRSVGP
jgi:uncharacterized membrane protein YsdA (DUF1294 family)